MATTPIYYDPTRQRQQQSSYPNLPGGPGQVPQAPAAALMPLPGGVVGNDMHAYGRYNSILTNLRSRFANDPAGFDQAAAPLLGANYNQNRGLVNDANTRMNDYNAGQVGLMNADAARTTALTPHEAGLMDSTAGVNNANAVETQAMTPIHVQMGQQQLDQNKALFPGQLEGQRLQNQTTAENNALIPGMGQASIDATNANVDRMKALEAENQRLNALVRQYQTQKSGGAAAAADAYLSPESTLGNTPGAAPATTGPAGGGPKMPLLPTTQPAGIPHVSSVAEAHALPPGTQFYDPQGILRVR